MSHPQNKRERFQIGNVKAKKRFNGENVCSWLPEEWSEKKIKEWTEKGIGLRRKTTKLCSCEMCGNPRRSQWNTKLDKLTMQEKRFIQSMF
jgi:hypothetical protein